MIISHHRLPRGLPHAPLCFEKKKKKKLSTKRLRYGETHPSSHYPSRRNKTKKNASLHLVRKNRSSQIVFQNVDLFASHESWSVAYKVVLACPRKNSDSDLIWYLSACHYSEKKLLRKNVFNPCSCLGTSLPKGGWWSVQYKRSRVVSSRVWINTIRGAIPLLLHPGCLQIFLSSSGRKKCLWKPVKWDDLFFVTVCVKFFFSHRFAGVNVYFTHTMRKIKKWHFSIYV